MLHTSGKCHSNSSTFTMIKLILLFVIFFVASTSSASSPPIESCCHDESCHHYSQYDAHYHNTHITSDTPPRRVGSVEVLPHPDKTNSTIAILKISTILAFSAYLIDPFTNHPRLMPRANGGMQSYSDVTGIHMAIHHFNNGIGSVVPLISSLNQTCPVRLVTDVNDSQSTPLVAVRTFLDLMGSSSMPPPAVLLGAWRSAVSIPLATIAGVYGIPQMSPMSTSTALDDVGQYQLFTRMIPSDAGTARAVVAYLARRLGVTHCGVLYVNDAYGAAYARAVKENARGVLNVESFGFGYGNVEEMKVALRRLKEEKWRVFFGVFYDEHFDVIMHEAFKLGIVGEGYLWIVGDGLSETYLRDRRYKIDSPLAIAAQGLGIIKAEGGIPTRSKASTYDRFLDSWYSQPPAATQYINCKQPSNNTENNPQIYYKAPPDAFQSGILPPSAGAAFAYDSVISLGIAACHLAKTNKENYFNGEDLFEQIVDTEFDGVTGRIVIDPNVTSRDPKSALFVLFNARGVEDGEEVAFDVDIVSHTVKDDLEIQWQDVEGESYIYAGGTTKPPELLPPVNKDLNQLGGVRWIGLTFSAVVMFGSIFLAIWTFVNRKRRAVKASQPIFLITICCGTWLLGVSIVSFSIDDEIAVVKFCSIACMASPWLVSLGFVVVFAALFSKIWRINRIFRRGLRLKRVKVTTRDVIRPFIILTVLNVVILLIWTIQAPLQWVRVDEEHIDRFGRSISSYGECASQEISARYYFIAIITINFAVLLLANFQVYRARKITTEYSESKYIAISMASILQSAIIGIPILVLFQNQPPAIYIVKSGLVFILCSSLLLLIFIPKIIHVNKANHERTTGSGQRSKKRRDSFGASGLAILSHDTQIIINQTIPADGSCPRCSSRTFAPNNIPESIVDVRQLKNELRRLKMDKNQLIDLMKSALVQNNTDNALSSDSLGDIYQYEKISLSSSNLSQDWNECIIEEGALSCMGENCNTKMTKTGSPLAESENNDSFANSFSGHEESNFCQDSAIISEEDENRISNDNGERIKNTLMLPF